MAAKSEALVAMLKGVERAFPELVYNVRGYGLYQGFSFRDPAMKSRLTAAALAEEELLLLGAGPDTIRLRPHLHVSEADITKLGEQLVRCIGRLA